MEMIYHITPSEQWVQAIADGEYRGDTLASDGFIHCSTQQQVIPVANAIFRGQFGLVLLCIDPRRLTSELRYESPLGPSVEGETTFPHIYGPLNVDAVVAIVDFPPEPDGLFLSPWKES